jgi:hypothetical protein
MLLFSLLFPLAAVALLPVLWRWRFALFYRANARDVTSPLEQWPLAVVIVPLRGADPGLDRCQLGALHRITDVTRSASFSIIDDRRGNRG